METLLTALRACAEPTRLRIIALAARGAFCVVDFTEILAQSQPRLSRHLRLLCDAAILERTREGANMWFTLPITPVGALARDLVARLPGDDPVLLADRRQAARVLAERARAASETFRRTGAAWDEMAALALPAAAVEHALLTAVGPDPGRLLDIGTGTGRLLELLAPRTRSAIGIDASRAMLALARTRLASAELSHCAVRQADMYRLPFADAGFDTVILQMVLHYAEDPAAALSEAARVLRPGGLLIVIDLAHHASTELAQRLAHRWLGFADDSMQSLLAAAQLRPGPPTTIPGPIDVRLWRATPQTGAPASAIAPLKELA